MGPLAVRRRFARRLTGQGIELGPGHVPFPVPDGIDVRYVDRWDPDENRSLFPELAESTGFPTPDIVANLDQDRLGAVADQSQDFVIASHLIEHLANPLAMVADIHRVLRPGGLLVLLVPDRHRNFDRHRPPTPLDHVVDEYRRDVREVDDEHVKEFVITTRAHTDEPGDPSLLAQELSPENLANHRRRSVHAHVWDADEFSELLDYAARELGVDWSVVDTMKSGEPGTYGDEFGWLLARGPARDGGSPGRHVSWARRLRRRVTSTRNH